MEKIFIAQIQIISAKWFMISIDIFILFSFLSLFIFNTFVNKQKYTTLDQFVYLTFHNSDFILSIRMFFTLLLTTCFLSIFEYTNIFQLFSLEQICCYVLKTLLIYFLIERIYNHKESISIAQTIGNIYGQSSHVISGICGLAFALILIVIQFKFIHQAIDTLFIINFNAAPLTVPFFAAYYIFFIHHKQNKLRSLILLFVCPLVLYYFCTINQKLTIYVAVISIFLYCNIAKSPSLYFNTMVNFSLTIIFLPIIFCEINHQSLSINADSKFSLEKLFILGNYNVKNFFIIFCGILISSINPFLIRTIQLARFATQAKKIFIFVSLILLIIIHLINYLQYCYIDITSINYSQSDIIVSLFEHVKNSKVFKGLALCSIISIIFGTIESTMSCANIFLINDIIQNRFYQLKNINYLSKIRSSSTIIIGTICLFLSLIKTNLSDTFSFIISIWASLVILPFLAQLYNLKLEKKAFYYLLINLALINSVYYFSNYSLLQNIGIFIISTFGSLLFFMILLVIEFYKIRRMVE